MPQRRGIHAMYVDKCRMCDGAKLHKFLDLGRTPPADQFLFSAQLSEKEQVYPLEVVICDDCGLVQLNFVVPPEVLYCNEYPYEFVYYVLRSPPLERVRRDHQANAET